MLISPKLITIQNIHEKLQNFHCYPRNFYNLKIFSTIHDLSLKILIFAKFFLDFSWKTEKFSIDIQNIFLISAHFPQNIPPFSTQISNISIIHLMKFSQISPIVYIILAINSKFSRLKNKKIITSIDQDFLSVKFLPNRCIYNGIGKKISDFKKLMRIFARTSCRFVQVE